MTRTTAMDSPIDWSAMTPREVYDALRAAPTKVMGAWEERPYYSGTRWLRTSVADANRYAHVSPEATRDGHWWWHVPGLGFDAPTAGHPTPESAMAAADEELRRRGWILVDAKGGV